MNNQRLKTLWPILVCTGIFALFVLLEIQQILVKHRPVEAAHE